MSGDSTQNLPPSFEERVLAEFAAIRQELAEQRSIVTRLDTRLTAVEARLTSLEEKVDERLRETRPIWEGVLQRLTTIEMELRTFNRQLKTVITDLFSLRVEKLEDEQPTT